MAISDRTRKILWGLSGGRCARCKTELVCFVDSTQPSIVGEECHIRAQSAQGPRRDESMGDKELHEYPNLILLCRICHKIIDDAPEKFNSNDLKKMKKDHEDLIANRSTENQTLTEYSPKFLGYLTLCKNELTSHLNRYPSLDDKALRLHMFRLFFMNGNGFFKKIEENLLEKISTMSDQRKAEEVLNWLNIYKDYDLDYLSSLEPSAKNKDTLISPFGAKERDILNGAISRLNAGLYVLEL